MRYTFLDHLDRDTLLVTAGQRLSRVLADDYARRQSARGLRAWERPAILPWQAWLQTCWNDSIGAAPEAESAAMLLAPAQERTLWERVIAESEQSNILLQVPATARVAQEAWRLLHERAIDPAALAEFASEDAQAFAGWAQRFSRWCEGKLWIDTARLPDRLAQIIRLGQLTLPRRLWLAGFDELAPQQERLLDAVRAAGCEVRQVEPEAYAVDARRVECVSAQEECVAMARWARERLEMNSRARIGIVVPDLAAQRASLARVFDEVLQPAALLPAGADHPRPWNISLGRPLADYPVIHSALMVLEFAHGSMAVEKVGSLLRSPYLLAAESEMTRRALLDARIRRYGEIAVSARSVMKAAHGGSEKDAAMPYACPRLADALDRWVAATDVLNRQHSPGEWSAVFAQLLSGLGWPGERSLDSTEYQAVEAWRELLSRFAGLDTVWPSTGYRQALSRLRRMASETLFQPETPDVPIQILGVLEAAGMQFDHLWVSGMHDECWPPAPRPNPLLPLVLQRRHGVPHASAERELEYARRVTTRLLASAPAVLLSYPRRDADRDLRPSPLVAQLPAASLAGILHGEWRAHGEIMHRASGPAREFVATVQAPALPEGARVRGGTAVFRQQAACPFRACAEFRLHASALDEPQAGLSAAERGTLLHAVLEYVWDTLTSHTALCRLTPEDELALVDGAVLRALAELSARRPGTFSDAFLALEKTRLARLVQGWLAVERERAPFNVIKPEAERLIGIGGLQVDAKIDRIDRLPDGDLAIVDYKTGKADVGQWFGERPDEPQLPLYSISAVSSGERIGAVMFGQVRLGELKYKGLARAEEVAPGVKSIESNKHAQEYASWDGLFDAWRVTLTRLAQEFRAGHAPVDPKDFPKTCRYCSLTPLCRIHEVNARAGRLSLDDDNMDSAEVGDE